VPRFILSRWTPFVLAEQSARFGGAADGASRTWLSARVSTSTISRLESGEAGRMTLDSIVSIARELEIKIDVIPRWRAEGLDRLLDEGHAEIVEALVHRYAAAGWEVAVEVSFAIRGERGSVDVLAFHPGTRIVAVNEVKSVVPDVQATIHGLDRKSRLAGQLGADRGWRSIARHPQIWRGMALDSPRGAARRRAGTHAAHDAVQRGEMPLVDCGAHERPTRRAEIRGLLARECRSDSAGCAANRAGAGHRRRPRGRGLGHG